jgi:endoglucanase
MTASKRISFGDGARPHRALLAVVAGVVLMAALLLPSTEAATAAGTSQSPTLTGVLRVDQDGFLPTDAKYAYLMASAPLSGETYQVVNSSGATVLAGSVTTDSRGSWNSAYPDVYPIDFTAITQLGTYNVLASGPVQISSDPFQIETASDLYGPLVLDGVNFFENQRDGADQATTTLDRQPSHQNDASATVYEDPHFIAGSDGGTGDQIKGDLVPIAGHPPVNVEGGWFDAGDYLKFTFTASYADDLLYAADLALGSAAPSALTTEAQYGAEWLNQMWDPTTETLYLQVGIGEGNETSYFGDHDLWRLPQVDDSNTNPADYYAAPHRPVFEAAAPGQLISPDLVGRVAAAFAFAARQDAIAGDSEGAEAELAQATSLYAMADTSAKENDKLTTTLPEAYYPEGIWHDAMELAATEIVLAEQEIGDPASTYLPYLQQATTYAAEYIKDDSGKDTLNLYDVSALAHADLIKAIDAAGQPTGLAVTTAQLIANLKAQLAQPDSKAAADIFREGGDYDNFDVDSHTFGFISTEALYQEASGDSEYASFAGEQRDWLFGGNPWGTSFMAGVGTTYPTCMAGQLENLDGPTDVGAVVNGPNNKNNFQGGLGGLQTGMVKCKNDSYEAFTGHRSEYVDDVRAWQTSEPALDMTGSAILAAALQDSMLSSTPGQSAASAPSAASPAGSR